MSDTLDYVDTGWHGNQGAIRVGNQETVVLLYLICGRVRRDLGGNMAFSGQAATVKCFESNPLVRKVRHCAPTACQVKRAASIREVVSTVDSPVIWSYQSCMRRWHNQCGQRWQITHLGSRKIVEPSKAQLQPAMSPTLLRSTELATWTR